MKLLEPQIKALVLNHLYESGFINDDACVINEFTIDKFARRVDLAIVKNQQLYAIEIKSDSDNLDRLEGQLSKYLEYFDKVIVIAASKHLTKVLENSPPNVGVWEVKDSCLKVKRRGKLSLIKDKSGFIRSLKVSELKKAANRKKIHVKALNRRVLEDSLSNSTAVFLRSCLMESLNQRYGETSSAIIQKLKYNKIIAEDISIMSPYKSSRDAANRHKAVTRKIWDDWLLKNQTVICPSSKPQDKNYLSSREMIDQRRLRLINPSFLSIN